MKTHELLARSDSDRYPGVAVAVAELSSELATLKRAVRLGADLELVLAWLATELETKVRLNDPVNMAFLLAARDQLLTEEFREYLETRLRVV